ncbi:Carbohydrate sulfotransferase 12 [Oopsacas minuta]|uniref:Carbohydrate sulfotransferase n=1 Tax=Oopsacas minuta TaxID=111878 RepID=A0AAV7KRL7_9METZ|nr:Carbohydrate sulfotransferase 12 [Oopsacas minuta]
MLLLDSKRRKYTFYILVICVQIVIVAYVWINVNSQKNVLVNWQDNRDLGSVLNSQYISLENHSKSGFDSTDKKEYNLENFLHSNWMEYRDRWNGEELVSMNDRIITFSPKYWEVMQTKGNHWLTENYPVFAERALQAEKYCALLREQSTFDSLDTTGRRLVYVDKYEILGCNVPKASSTTMTKTYMRLDQVLLDHQLHKGPGGSSLNISMSNSLDDNHVNARRIQTYLKVVLTRHPFSWIGSKYYFKVNNFANKEFQREECPEIIKSLYLGGLPTNENKFINDRQKLYEHLSDREFEEKLFQIRRYNAGPGKYNVTLLEYIQSLIYARKKFKNVYAGQSRICNPCAVHYDVILQCTNGFEEINRVLDFIQRDKPSEKRVHYPLGTSFFSQAKCNEEFSAIPIDIREKLYQFYEVDFMLFGYEFQNDPENLNACY